MIGSGISFTARLLCVICGVGPAAFFALVAVFDLQDHATLMFLLLLLVWGVGTAWVLAARATEVGGWGELQISEVLFIPFLTLVSVLGTAFMLLLWGLGHMH
jgi:hypothetical protein